MVKTKQPNIPFPSNASIFINGQSESDFWRNNPPDIWAGQPTKWLLERCCGNVNYN